MLVVYLDPRLNTSYKVSSQTTKPATGTAAGAIAEVVADELGPEPALGDRHAASGHQERQRVAIRSHVDHQDDTAERRRWEGKEDAGVPLRLSVPVRWL